MESYKYKKNIGKALFVLFFLLSFPLQKARAIESENYKINADAFGVGGSNSSSENYILKDTLGEPLVGIGTSENYKGKAGFWYMVTTSLSILVDSETVNLGTVNPGIPQVGQSTITVKTDSWNGYDLLVNQNHALTHTDTTTTIPDYSCNIDSPCLWSGTGLGFTLKSGTGVGSKWGTNPDYKYAAFPLSATVFHEKTGFSSGGDETVVEYKVDISATQKAGNYSSILTYTAMENL